jgi:general stress protein 26
MAMTLADLSKKMQAIDFCMLFTRVESGAMAGRPMSNNGDVEYDGDSYFFTFEDSTAVHDIEGDPTVALSFAGPKGLFGNPGLFIAVEGTADLIREKAKFSEHWTKNLDRWFANGIDTPGIVLIMVHAQRVHYWDGEDNGEVKLHSATPIMVSGA